MNFIGNDAGRKLKATYGWNGNGNGTNEYGFSALPGGYSFINDEDYNIFHDLGYYGLWWSTTEEPEWEDEWAYTRIASYDADTLQGVPPDWGREKKHFHSVRCVRD
jgi:uncharacterized protein (TIGR02145 family)